MPRCSVPFLQTVCICIAWSPSGSHGSEKVLVFAIHTIMPMLFGTCTLHPPFESSPLSLPSHHSQVYLPLDGVGEKCGGGSSGSVSVKFGERSLTAYIRGYKEGRTLRFEVKTLAGGRGGAGCVGGKVSRRCTCRLYLQLQSQCLAILGLNCRIGSASMQSCRTSAGAAADLGGAPRQQPWECCSISASPQACGPLWLPLLPSLPAGDLDVGACSHKVLANKVVITLTKAGDSVTKWSSLTTK